MKAVVLVDGEHYPPVVRAAIDELRATGVTPVSALVLGGTEKVTAYGAELGLGCPTEWTAGTGDVASLARTGEQLRGVLARTGAEEVIDLSDEPLLDGRRRLGLAAHALLADVPYRGADFAFQPPARPLLCQRPSIAVLGTGKRTGKTAVTGALVRSLAAGGRRPVVVAMGRGGPAEPVLVEAGAPVELADLLRVADAGGHAASDFYEDALTTRAATVGARRCGGGLAGAVAHSNVAAAIALAEAQPGDLTVLEGSGAAIPPAAADVSVLVASAASDPELLVGYLGAYRILLADLIVVTMAPSPTGSPQSAEPVVRAIRSIARSTPIVCTVLRPVPLDVVSGARVFFATTAPAVVVSSLVESLERHYGCEVVGVSNQLADRPALRAQLAQTPAFEVLLVELKAAAVDVAARIAAERGAAVVFCDNRPSVLSWDEPGRAAQPEAPEQALQTAISELARRAEQRSARA